VGSSRTDLVVAGAGWIPYYLSKRTPVSWANYKRWLALPENNEVTLYGIAPARLTSIQLFTLVKFIVAKVGARRGLRRCRPFWKKLVCSSALHDITGDIGVGASCSAPPCVPLVGKSAAPVAHGRFAFQHSCKDNERFQVTSLVHAVREAMMARGPGLGVSEGVRFSTALAWR